MDDQRKEQLFEEEFSQIIDFFPYPLAIFTQQYEIVVVNKAFAAETKALRILQYKIDDIQLAAAVTRVFSGDTFFLEDVKNPFSMFSATAQQSATQHDRFKKTVVFPVPGDDAEITHGVIVFIP